MSKKPFWMITAGLLLGTTAAHASGASEDQFSLAAGVDYTSGKYGTDTTTDIWSVPLTATYNMDRWTFKLVVPYIGISGAGNVIPGVGRVNNTNPHGRGHGHGTGAAANAGTTTASGTGSASGLGDIVASAGYEVFQSNDHSFGVDLTGKIKFGTADANQGLGTGENDYGASLDTYKVYGNWTAFGGVGWMKYGSSPYIQLKNGFNANVGLGYKLSHDDDFGAYYYYREKIAANGGQQSEVTAYWNHKLNQNLRLQAYVLGGFANGSPDYGLGASLKYLF
ncbi:transporter [Dyella psychrodurans]|uniref:Transporter n=1 Tax=Dyella psychrodurans TaxID=1927960 RepID=A0A370X165_9GAMM|nr:transporter [Dyella psychrodurans]RDS82007.1 transporter [Dyella psychrodurans]